MQVAFLVDGAFFEKKYKSVTKSFPRPTDIILAVAKAMEDNEFRNDMLFRIYYYDCEPFDGITKHPLTGEAVDFGATAVYKRKAAYLRELRLLPRVAFRSGTLSYDGWNIPQRKIKQILARLATGGLLQKDDLTISLSQKKVDIKIGLDMAWLASRRIVQKIVLVTSDSDFVPAMKLARKEGVMIYLVHFDHAVKEELKEHCDGIIDVGLKALACGLTHCPR